MTPSLPPEYFEELYNSDPDPWRFATSDYERAKYQASLNALPARMGAAFEIGCSIGVLTRALAARCDALLAVDVAETALAQARIRCAGLDNVAIARMHIPQQWPSRMFDAIVLSEVLYYLSPVDVRRTAQLTMSALTPGGVVLLVHYTMPTDYPQTGDAASNSFIDLTGLKPDRQLREKEYRLDLLAA